MPKNHAFPIIAPRLLAFLATTTAVHKNRKNYACVPKISADLTTNIDNNGASPNIWHQNLVSPDASTTIAHAAIIAHWRRESILPAHAHILHQNARFANTHARQNRCARRLLLSASRHWAATMRVGRHLAHCRRCVAIANRKISRRYIQHRWQIATTALAIAAKRNAQIKNRGGILKTFVITRNRIKVLRTQPIFGIITIF